MTGTWPEPDGDDPVITFDTVGGFLAGALVVAVAAIAAYRRWRFVR